MNPDAFVSTGQGLTGYNMFAYCENNPVMYRDAIGLSSSDFWTGFGAFIEAVHNSSEFQIGFGFGLGFNLWDIVSVSGYRDTYVGLDDGEWITGNQIGFEATIFDAIGLGDTYNHMSEKGGNRVTSSTSPNDGPFDMINYPDTTHGDIFSIGIFSINNEGEFVISLEAETHILIGGHAQARFNVTEFFERLSDLF